MKRYMTLMKSLILAVAGFMARGFIAASFIVASLVAAVGLVATSCVQDSALPGAKTDAPETGEVLINFRANMSGAGQLATRAADDWEFAVNKIDLLVFDQPGGTGALFYRYRVQGRKIFQENNTTVDFEALLPRSEQLIRVLMVANCPEGMLDGMIPGITEAEVRGGLFTANFDFSQGMPMTGLTNFFYPQSAPGVVPVMFMRSIAKTTVAVDLREDSPPFRLSDVTVFRRPSTWQLFPTAGNIYNEIYGPMPVAPSIPTYSRVTDPAVNVSVSQFFSGYLTESADPAMTTAACLVVGGYFGTDVTPSYYRIDFGKEGYDARPVGQVLRNYWYQFTIVGVTARGYPTAVEASNNPPTGLLTTVLPWNGGGNTDYYFGDDDYIKLTETSLRLPIGSINTSTLDIFTSEVPFTITANGVPGQQFTSETDSEAQDMYLTDSDGNILLHYRLAHNVPIETPGEQIWTLAVYGTAAGSAVTEVFEMHAADGLLTIQIPFVRYDTPASLSAVSDFPSAAPVR